MKTSKAKKMVLSDDEMKMVELLRKHNIGIESAVNRISDGLRKSEELWFKYRTKAKDEGNKEREKIWDRTWSEALSTLVDFNKDKLEMGFKEWWQKEDIIKACE